MPNQVEKPNGARKKNLLLVFDSPRITALTPKNFVDYNILAW